MLETILICLRRKIPELLCALCLAVLAVVMMQEAALAVTAPTITPPTGCYSQVQSSVTISADPGDTIYYTTNGTEPTTSSTVYSGTISIGEKAVIKAIAWNSGVSSAVTTSNIQSDPNSKPVPRSGLQLWLKNDFTPSTSGSQVVSWSDLSGANPANDATQTTASARPTLVNDVINGYAGVRSNGSSQFLNLTAGIADASPGLTIISVIQPASSSTATVFTMGNAGPTDMFSLETVNTQARANYYNGTTGSAVTSPSGSLVLNKMQILDAVQDGSHAATLSVNGVNVAIDTVQNLNNTARSLNFIASDNASSTFWNGDLVELLVYNRGLAISELADVDSYLYGRYQLTTAQQTPAPIISVPSGTLTKPTQVAVAFGGNAKAFYSQDGSTPDPNTSPEYKQPINISYSQTVKIIAVANGVASTVSSATYNLDPSKFPAPNPSDPTPLQVDLDLPTTSQ